MLLKGDMEDCLFCKIINREISANIVFENDNILAFEDIEPQAPIHLLIIPKKHIASINDIEPKDNNICGDMLLAAKEIANMMNVDGSGFRTIFNTNEDAGQTVFHIHMHFLAGRKMKWPPG